MKYDILMFFHPFEEATEMLPRLRGLDDTYLVPHQNSYIRVGSGYFVKRLEELGVPRFGYDVNASKRERKESKEQIIEWLLEVDEDWDVSEPKLKLPKDRYEVLMRRIKKYR